MGEGIRKQQTKFNLQWEFTFGGVGQRMDDEFHQLFNVKIHIKNLMPKARKLMDMSYTGLGNDEDKLKVFLCLKSLILYISLLSILYRCLCCLTDLCNSNFTRVTNLDWAIRNSGLFYW